MIFRNGLWVCEECGLRYREKFWAEKCEEWCRKHGTCNLEIIKHAVGGFSAGINIK